MCKHKIKLFLGVCSCYTLPQLQILFRYRYRYIYDFSRSHSYFVWERCSAHCLGPQLPLEHSP